jgi:hypothetical protein
VGNSFSLSTENGGGKYDEEKTEIQDGAACLTWSVAMNLTVPERVTAYNVAKLGALVAKCLITCTAPYNADFDSDEMNESSRTSVTSGAC